MTEKRKHSELAAAADPEQAGRNAIALKKLTGERDDIGDDEETLKVIEASRAAMAERTEQFHAASKKARSAGAPGAATSTTVRSR